MSFSFPRHKRTRIFCLALAALLLVACDNNTPLMKDVLDENADKVSQTLGQAVDVNATNRYGWTALMHAARLGNTTIMTLLLDHGADINMRDKSGWTALMRAAVKGHQDAVKLLLERGANTDIQDEEGYTALHWAAHRGHIVVVKQLLDAGANPNLKNRDGWTPMMVALQENEQDVATLLQPYTTVR